MGWNVNESELDSLITPFVLAAYQRGRADASPVATANGTHPTPANPVPHSEDEDDEDDAPGGFTEADLAKFHDYFEPDEKGHYPDSAFKTFRTNLKQFADATGLVRKGVERAGKPGWVWVKRKDDAPDTFSDWDESEHPRDAGKFAPKEGGGDSKPDESNPVTTVYRNVIKAISETKSRETTAEALKSAVTKLRELERDRKKETKKEATTFVANKFVLSPGDSRRVGSAIALALSENETGFDEAMRDALRGLKNNTHEETIDTIESGIDYISYDSTDPDEFTAAISDSGALEDYPISMDDPVEGDTADGLHAKYVKLDSGVPNPESGEDEWKYYERVQDWAEEKRQGLAGKIGEAWVKRKAAEGEPATFSQDAQGHEHKGKGEGGGQFVKGSGGGSGEEKPDKPSKKPVEKPYNKTVEKSEESAKVPRKAPGSQLTSEQRAHATKLGMTGTFPPHDVSVENIKFASPDATPEEMEFKPIMQWDQKTKSGRISRQYRYTQAFHDRNAAAKFERVKAVEPYLKEAIPALHERMTNSGLSERDRDAAAIASVIAETGLRPTDGDDSIKHGHYGIASLLAHHATVKGNEIHLDFIGKEGVRNQTIIRDPANVAFLKSKLASKEGNESLWAAGSDHAGDALKEAVTDAGGPADVKLKDLRTIKATETARKVVADYKGPPPPLSGNEKKDVKAITSAILTMSGEVAKVLNNTASQARDNYIHPEIFKSWQAKLQKPS